MVECVSALLDAGARTDRTEEIGLTAKELAQAADHPRCGRLVAEFEERGRQKLEVQQLAGTLKPPSHAAPFVFVAPPE